VLEGADMRENVFGMVEDELKEMIATHLPGRNEDGWDRETLIDDVRSMFALSPEAQEEIMETNSIEEIEALILDEAEAVYDAKEAEVGADSMRLLERLLLLQAIDRLWVEHLTAVDEMRQGIGLKAYGQQDPLVAYKREAHDMWGQLLENIRHTVARAIFHVGLAQAPRPPQPARVPVGAAAPAAGGQSTAGSQPAQAAGPSGLRENRPDQAAAPAAKANGKKIGRNDPCYCGSGKKYKRCHGAGL
jgi:preprotein translocase subunit SecA